MASAVEIRGSFIRRSGFLRSVGCQLAGARWQRGVGSGSCSLFDLWVASRPKFGLRRRLPVCHFHPGHNWFDRRAMPAGDHPTVLHYVGYDTDVGGIVSVVRALAGSGQFTCVLGMNRGSVQARTPPLEVLGVAADLRRKDQPCDGGAGVRCGARRPEMAAERSIAGFFTDIHAPGCSLRAGSGGSGSAGWWPRYMCLAVSAGSTRRAAAALGRRLCWLGPAMKSYYGLPAGGWEGCLPDCIPESKVQPMASASDAAGGDVRLCRRHRAGEALETGDRGAGAGARCSADARCACGAGRRFRRWPGLCRPRLPGAGWTSWPSGLVSPGGVWWKRWRTSTRAIDCLVVPSSSEASSVAALEAIAAGVPVLASAASGTRDLVERCGGGWLFTPDTAEGAWDVG